MTTTRILVTGGAGFIGSHYVRTLLGPAGPGDIEITVLDKLTYAGNPANLDPVRSHPAFRFVHGDICDTRLVAELVAGHEQIVHFAAESHVDRSILGAAEFITTNVLGTQTLLDAALRRPGGPARFLHVSTDEVYGSLAEGSWPESDLLRPNSPYAASKASTLVALSCTHRTHGLDVRATRCSNNYGHHHFPEKVIPLFVTNLLDGHRVPLYGEGLNVRDRRHIDDHVQGLKPARTGGRPGEVYNIGGGTELSNKELTTLLLDLAGRPGTASSTCPTGSATTCATRWTARRSPASSATAPARTSPRAWPRPSPGTATTAPGGSSSTRPPC